MSELLVNTIKKADGTGSLTVPAESGTVVVKDGSNDVTLNNITATGVYLGGTGAANYLDDYEEGTWTPVAVSSSGTITSYTSSGTYIKIGDFVHARWRVQFTDVGSASGDLRVQSLPFTTENSARPFTAIVREDSFTGIAYILYGDPNDTFGRVSTLTNGGIAFNNNYSYVASFTYRTT